MTFAKPAHLGLGDFLLKAAFDAHLHELIVAGRYREVQATLDTHFGPAGHGPEAVATVVATRRDRGGEGAP